MLSTLMRPLIAICGTTGVGKSKLGIELALALSDCKRKHGGFQGARIINADAMQVYAGLDVLTNKVSTEEQRGVEHLLMGFRKPEEQYVVGQWVNEASRLIDETHERNQIPIVVGGTSYWIQHLVFPGRLVAVFGDDSDDELERPSAQEAPPDERSQSLLKALSSLPPELLSLFNHLPEERSTSSVPENAYTLHKLLFALDPAAAQRWHWKNTRKVLSSLKIIRHTGKLLSEIIDKQSEQTPRPRYRTLCFWLYANPEVLNPRLDARVDQMLEQGLLDEITELQDAARGPTDAHKNHDAESSQQDYQLGLYQSIGYREFSAYLSNKPTTSAVDNERLFREAVDRMKLATRRYARKQVSWIRNKFLPAAYATNRAWPDEGELVSSYLLDATELDEWTSNVLNKANSITEDFLEGRLLPNPLSLSENARTMFTIQDKLTDPNAVLIARRHITCPVCTTREDEPVMIEEGTDWVDHVGSRRHRRLKRQAEGARHANSPRGKASSSSPVEDNLGDNLDAARTLFDS